jgi:hypothetical protein
LHLLICGDAAVIRREFVAQFTYLPEIVKQRSGDLGKVARALKAIACNRP